MPRTSVTLKLGLQGLRIGERSDLAAGIEMLGEAGDVGVSVGSEAGIVLIIVLGR